MGFFPGLAQPQKTSPGQNEATRELPAETGDFLGKLPCSADWDFNASQGSGCQVKVLV